MTVEPQMPDSHPIHKKRGLLAGFRANFLTGLVVVLPIGLTIWLIWNIVGWIDGWVLPFIPQVWHPDALLTRYLGYETPVSVRGVGVIMGVEAALSQPTCRVRSPGKSRSRMAGIIDDGSGAPRRARKASSATESSCAF